MRLYKLMADIENTIEKDLTQKAPRATSAPGLHAQPIAQLKARLEWGEPALTILDMRDRSEFDKCHIRGAMNVTKQNLEAVLTSLAPDRHIYIYAAQSEEAVAAADRLREAGFTNVAELTGGIPAWLEIGGAVVGSATSFDSPRPDMYNVFSRMQRFSKEKAREKAMSS